MLAKVQALGLAGVVAYGLTNTLYYTITFITIWTCVAKVRARARACTSLAPTGQAAQPWPRISLRPRVHAPVWRPLDCNCPAAGAPG